MPIDLLDGVLVERIRKKDAEIASLKYQVNNKSIDAAHYERELRMLKAGLCNEAKDKLRKRFENSIDNAGLSEAMSTEKKRYKQ